MAFNRDPSDEVTAAVADHQHGHLHHGNPNHSHHSHHHHHHHHPHPGDELHPSASTSELDELASASATATAATAAAGQSSAQAASAAGSSSSPSDAAGAGQGLHHSASASQLMQDSSDEEEEAPSDQKSVIFHLLKQLSIGMDLTKVTLPTFVLEKRSLLEMYADFMANPMAWLKVGDSNDPKERMMQCVFAYITSFHGFKKGTIAKKPYNPIIGETFECQYDLTAEGAGISTYFAEQVSHHPPVSAFYFENKQKGISIAADVWTQSKFLGTSVASLLVGQSTLTLHKRNEQYVMTYPNVYGRSILSVPKLELGGKTTIVCSQTGFTADVEFKTKPMFGGSYHELLCTVKEPNAKAPFVKISGKWNEVLVIQYTGAKEAPYFDAAKAIKVNKSVRALDVQAPFESRRLWKDVTENLRAGNIPAATAAKELLENRQRQEAAERKQANTEWKVKHFSKNDQGRWIYHHAA